MAVQAWTIGKDPIPEADRWTKIIRRYTFTDVERELNVTGMREAMSFMGGYIIVQEDDETPVMMHSELFEKEYEWV